MNAFEAYGIEAEYMILDSKTFGVRNEAEFILKYLNGNKIADDASLGSISLSNELVSHVIELKCTEPMSDLEEIERGFTEVLKILNCMLEEKGALLCGTAAHPTMNPLKDSLLWTHGYNEVYRKFNEIFDCRGHGWSNLQSIHINLPYGDEEEFGRLHAAIRLVLPLFPYVCAASPIVDNTFTEYPDRRLKFYENNQKKIPSITGYVIPERVFTFSDYRRLLQGVYKDIAPYDPHGILQHPWLNSRGAIIKFDLGAIEIRLMDIQESPVQDFSIISFFIEVIRDLYFEKWMSYEDQKMISEKELAEVYLNANTYEDKPVPQFYSDIFQSDRHSYQGMIDHLFQRVKNGMPERYQEGIRTILLNGHTARRMREYINRFTPTGMMEKLTYLLRHNEPLILLPKR